MIYSHMRIILLLIFAVSIQLTQAQTCNCDSVFTFIYAQWDEVENMSYHSHKIERQMDETTEGEFDFIVQRKPYKVAGVMTGKGHRLLYDPTQRKDEALYISKGFPYTNMWLDIHGKIFRGMNHYTISNAGCEFIFGIIRNEYHRMPDRFTCTKKQKGAEEVIEIYAETEKFEFKNYHAEKGENLLSIGEKFGVMSYIILENNPSVDNYTDDCGGLNLKIPSQYGHKVKLTVDAKHGMPVGIEVHDLKGMVEVYRYTNYEFDKQLPDNYFTEDYLDSLD